MKKYLPIYFLLMFSIIGCQQTPGSEYITGKDSKVE